MTDKPDLFFEWDAPVGALPLRDRLVQETSETLAKAGKSQHSFRNDLTALYKARGIVDTRVYPVWKTCSKYVNIYPVSLDDMIDVLGWEGMKSMCPIDINWTTIERAKRILERYDKPYYQSWWYEICDAVESGELNHYYYGCVCVDYLYSKPGRAVGSYGEFDHDSPKKSKALVLQSSSRVPYT